MKFFPIAAILCAVGCLMLPCLTQAQNISLTGRVSSEANSEPVPFATVVLSTDSLGRQGMKFTTTNANGQFTLRDVPTNPRQRWLIMRWVGYEQHTQRVDMASVQSPLSIALKTSTIGIEEVADLGGTMRLGAYPCKLSKSSHAFEAYGSADIQERHRHRYEFNSAYKGAI